MVLVRTQTVLHFPRLDTVLMVEDAIKKAKGYPTKMSLWKSLPKKVQYQTFNVILNYLKDSHKILFTKDNKILWVFADTPKARRLLENSVKAYA